MDNTEPHFNVDMTTRTVLGNEYMKLVITDDTGKELVGIESGISGSKVWGENITIRSKQ
ncbi:hypothetical protein [Weissella hellenica]|uniref:hypothetical protein n=1 Tax=Weissella hellenica TaxID=46256 RepID=UPI00163BD595